MSGDETLADVIYDSWESWMEGRRRDYCEQFAADIVAAVNEGRIPPIVPEGQAVVDKSWLRGGHTVVRDSELASLRALKARVDGCVINTANGYDWIRNVGPPGREFRYASSLLAWLREPTDER